MGMGAPARRELAPGWVIPDFIPSDQEDPLWALPTMFNAPRPSGASPAVPAYVPSRNRDIAGGEGDDELMGNAFRDQVMDYAMRGVRRGPLKSDLTTILEQAAQNSGVTGIRVISGGQPGKGESGPRKGSIRHDHGGAADIQLLVGDRVLEFTNPADRPVFESFVRNAAALGATGIGAGVGYMGPRTIHVGFGAPGTWGAGGRSATAPAWLTAAWKAGREGGVEPVRQAARLAGPATGPALGARLAAEEVTPPSWPSAQEAVTMLAERGYAGPDAVMRFQQEAMIRPTATGQIDLETMDALMNPDEVLPSPRPGGRANMGVSTPPPDLQAARNPTTVVEENVGPDFSAADPGEEFQSPAVLGGNMAQAYANSRETMRGQAMEAANTPAGPRPPPPVPNPTPRPFPGVNMAAAMPPPDRGGLNAAASAVASRPATTAAAGTPPAADAAGGVRRLRVGDRGEDVRAVQGQLSALGFDSGKWDGVYGPKTARAVLAYQRAAEAELPGKVGGKLDAIAGPITQNALHQDFALVQSYQDPGGPTSPMAVGAEQDYLAGGMRLGTRSPGPRGAMSLDPIQAGLGMPNPPPRPGRSPGPGGPLGVDMAAYPAPRPRPPGAPPPGLEGVMAAFAAGPQPYAGTTLPALDTSGMVEPNFMPMEERGKLQSPAVREIFSERYEPKKPAWASEVQPWDPWGGIAKPGESPLMTRVMETGGDTSGMTTLGPGEQSGTLPSPLSPMAVISSGVGAGPPMGAGAGPGAGPGSEVSGTGDPFGDSEYNESFYTTGWI